LCNYQQSQKKRRCSHRPIHSLATICCASSCSDHFRAWQACFQPFLLPCIAPSDLKCQFTPLFLLAFMYITVLISWRKRTMCRSSRGSQQDKSNCTRWIECNSGRAQKASRHTCRSDDILGPSTPPLSSIRVRSPGEMKSRSRLHFQS
jgi:hypothetical protein